MSYFGLTEKVHFTVHSKYLIDPFTGTNTQTIESSKRSMKTGIRSEYSAEHL